VWDFGHVAQFTQEWLLVRLGAAPVAPLDRAERYDPEAHPRGERESELEARAAMFARLKQVHSAALGILRDGRFDARDPLVQGGWVWRMVAAHNDQHAEILIQWAQLVGCAVDVGAAQPAQMPAGDAARERVSFAPGPRSLGAPARSGYDNESPPHTQHVQGFEIERWPLSNRRLIAFVDAGGYRDPVWWSPAGARFLAALECKAPHKWRRESDGTFTRERFGLRVPVKLDEPAEQLCAHEADALARFFGAQLPSEAQWECAARAGALELASRGVWEWTLDTFGPYPGFEAWPYDAYSKVHFGRGYRVLRGCAWTATARLARATYRNWDLPERRQLFAGLRLVYPASSARAARRPGVV